MAFVGWKGQRHLYEFTADELVIIQILRAKSSSVGVFGPRLRRFEDHLGIWKQNAYRINSTW